MSAPRHFFPGNGHRTRFYTSTDSGKDWTSIELNENLNYPTIVPNIPQRIFRIGDILFIVAQDFLLRSIDFGARSKTLAAAAAADMFVMAGMINVFSALPNFRLLCRTTRVSTGNIYLAII